MQSIWLPTAMTLIKLRHLQLQCCAPGVVGACMSKLWLLFCCCAVYTKTTDLQENGNDIHNVLMTTRGS